MSNQNEAMPSEELSRAQHLASMQAAQQKQLATQVRVTALQNAVSTLGDSADTSAIIDAAKRFENYILSD